MLYFQPGIIPFGGGGGAAAGPAGGGLAISSPQTQTNLPLLKGAGAGAGAATGAGAGAGYTETKVGPTEELVKAFCVRLHDAIKNSGVCCVLKSVMLTSYRL